MNKNAFPDLLLNLGFTKHGNLLTKSICGSRLIVDTKNEKLVYPEDDGLIVNERQTCNFSQLENFVVFECVHRLLVKGYAPRHIELEPKWKVGHGASGGRADILIKDNSGKPLLIIECKTAGAEFDKYWKKTRQDGDQLFSYAQQISETQFLCLYASDYSEENGATYKNHVIAHRDNEKYLADNPLFRGFRDAVDVKDRFSIWRDTYKLDYTPTGIFEETIQPYQIGKDKYSLTDLHRRSAEEISRVRDYPAAAQRLRPGERIRQAGQSLSLQAGRRNRESRRSEILLERSRLRYSLRAA